MKSKYQAQKEQLKEAFSRFEEVMGKPKDAIVRDAAIQRFEFTFELLWKTLKSHLRSRGAEEITFPKDILKEAFRAGLIDEEERWFDMLDTRNMTSHIYCEKMADEAYSKFSGYLDLIGKLINNLP